MPQGGPVSRICFNGAGLARTCERTDWAMIRIRYKELSAGLHGKAERSARRTTVYLLPGLTGRQRRAALRRLRQEASRDCGPPLPLPQLMVAIGVDRTREAVRAAAAVIRLHPAAIVLPTIVTGTLMALFVLGSVRIVHLPVSGTTAESPPAIGHPAGALSPPAPTPADSLRPGAAAGGGGSAGPGGQRNSGRRPRQVPPTAPGAPDLARERQPGQGRLGQRRPPRGLPDPHRAQSAAPHRRPPRAALPRARSTPSLMASWLASRRCRAGLPVPGRRRTPAAADRPRSASTSARWASASASDTSPVAGKAAAQVRNIRGDGRLAPCRELPVATAGGG
jgi:hypothetical protein